MEPLNETFRETEVPKFPREDVLLEVVADWFMHEVDCVSDDVGIVVLVVVLLLEAAGPSARTAIKASVATSTTTKTSTAWLVMAGDARLLVFVLP
jgi:hypothetical protein